MACSLATHHTRIRNQVHSGANLNLTVVIVQEGGELAGLTVHPVYTLCDYARRVTLVGFTTLSLPAALAYNLLSLASMPAGGTCARLLEQMRRVHGGVAAQQYDCNGVHSYERHRPHAAEHGQRERAHDDADMLAGQDVGEAGCSTSEQPHANAHDSDVASSHNPVEPRPPKTPRIATNTDAGGDLGLLRAQVMGLNAFEAINSLWRMQQGKICKHPTPSWGQPALHDYMLRCRCASLLVALHFVAITRVWLGTRPRPLLTDN